MLVKLKETGDLITLNSVDFIYGKKYSSVCMYLCMYMCMKGLYVYNNINIYIHTHIHVYAHFILLDFTWSTCPSEEITWNWKSLTSKYRSRQRIH